MSRNKPTTSPTRQPIRRSKTQPIVEPISAPAIEKTTYWPYEAPYYNLKGHPGYGKLHNAYWGDRLEYESFTREDAEDYIIRNKLYGDFIIAERVNGRVSGVAFPFQNKQPEHDVDYDGDLRVENAALKTRIELMREGRNGYDPVTKAVMERVVPEMLKPKSLAEQLRELREANELINPRRENPAPQQGSESGSGVTKLIEKIIEHGDGPMKEMALEKAMEWVKGEKAGQDILMDVLQSPQLIPVAQTVCDTALKIFDRIFPPRPAPVSAEQAAQAPQQVAQHPQQQQVAPQAAQQPLPEAPQQQAPQEFIPPEQQALMFTVDHCARNQPVQIAFDRLMNYADAVNEQAPQYSIDGYIEMLATTPTDAVIEYLKTLPNGAHVANLPHTRNWCEMFQRAIRESGFLDEDAEPFDRVTEVNGGNVKL